MTKFIIDGPCTLRGTTKVEGSKNAALKILAGTLLAHEPVTLTNVPKIRDVSVMLDILRCFGMKITGAPPRLKLDPSKLRPAPIPDHLSRSLRASIVVLGPALARFGRVRVAHPGGDVIGRRPLDTHFRAIKALGGSVEQTNSHYRITAKRLRGKEIFLEEASVTATENLIMAAATARGTTRIHNAASELHTADLAKFLTTLGADIEGAGTNLVTVRGVERLGGGVHEVRPDEIEAATLMIAAALTDGDVTLTGVDPERFGMILIKLREAGIRFTTHGDRIRVHGRQRIRPTNVKTNIWPGFPTDLQPPFTVLMTQAKGMSVIHDWMYEGRLFYTDKLVSMGANITMADPHRIIVLGPTPLAAKELESPDIRAGISLLVAALIANGKTTIDHAEWIERGYERIPERLRRLGAKIRRVAE
ncbi:MAG: UDP-N-acetylglucosamine 1-carboxyvinyltransferase [Patescibacteria group bacterium]